MRFTYREEEIENLDWTRPSKARPIIHTNMLVWAVARVLRSSLCTLGGP
jgi:hypothetical protein